MLVKGQQIRVQQRDDDRGRAGPLIVSGLSEAGSCAMAMTSREPPLCGAGAAHAVSSATERHSHRHAPPRIEC